MESSSRDTTHDLLLALAGRVDDDLLAWARELVAVGEDVHAVEMLTASLTADRVALPAEVRGRLVELARSARIELDADSALAPAGLDDGTEHRFVAEEALAGRVATALISLPARQLQDCRVLLTHRRTPAGSAPAPLPHPVLIVEVEPGARRPDMLSYQLTVALERSGVVAAVEVLTVGGPVPAYHAEALRSARQLRLEGNRPTDGGRRAAEATVAVAALPNRRRPEPSHRGADPGSDEFERPSPDRPSAQRQAGATQPISAAAPFGTSNSDTPLFDSPALDDGHDSLFDDRSDADDRPGPTDDDRPEPDDEPAPRPATRLTAVPTVFDEPSPDGNGDGFPTDFRSDDVRSDDFGRDDFGREEFGRDRRSGPAHRAAPAARAEEPAPRPSPRPKPRPAPVTPITRSPSTGPTPIPLLRRGSNGRRPLSPVDQDDNGNRRPDGFDPLHDPLSRPLEDPLLDPTPPLTGLTGPIGLVDAMPSRPSAVAEESWSGDWLSGAWAVSRDGEEAAGGADPAPEAGEPAPETPPPPKPIGRRSARHRYLRTPDDPPEDQPAPRPAPRSAEDGLPAAGTGPIPAVPPNHATQGRPAHIPAAHQNQNQQNHQNQNHQNHQNQNQNHQNNQQNQNNHQNQTTPHQIQPKPEPPPPAPAPAPSGPPAGSVPLGPGTGAIMLPTGGSGAYPAQNGKGRVPQTPTRPALPTPATDRAEPRSEDLPDVDPALGLRPESIARLGEADLDLLAKLQAELRSGRGGRPEHPTHGTNGPGTNGAAVNGHDTNGRPGYRPGVNGTGANGAPHGPHTNGHREPDRNGNQPRRGPFSRRRDNRAGTDGDGPPPPDIAG